MSEIDIKDLIKEKVDIAELTDYMVKNNLFHPKAVTNEYAFDAEGNVNLFVDLRKENAVKIVCPRHKTKRDNSTSLHRERNTFKCWAGGCELEGVTLNLFDFYMVFRFNVPPKLLGDKQVGEEFKQTIKELAEYAGIPYNPASNQLSGEALRKKIKLEIRSEAAEYYHEEYKTNPLAHKAKTYMEETRGFKYGVNSFETLVERFKIGFSSGDFGTTALYDYLKSKNYTDEQIIDAGVCFTYQYKKKIYDDQNKVVGFQAIGEPKIIDRLTNGVIMPYFERNSVTNLYARSLKAVSKDFRHMRLSGTVDEPIHFDVAQHYSDIIVVEGEFSWLSLIALGYENTIGNRGTNGLGAEHVQMLKNIRDHTNWKQCSKIYLCFDPDEPGQNAIAVTGERLVAEGFDVRVIRMKDGDPNDFLQAHQENAKKEFQKLYDEAITYEAFRVLREAEKHEIKTHADKAAFFKKIKIFKEKMDKDVRLIVAYEVADKLKIDKHELMQAWDIMPKPERKNIPGFERAVKMPWIFAISDEELYNLLCKSGFPNAIHIQNIPVMEFASRLKEHSEVKKIVYPSTMEESTKKEIRNHLSNFNFIQLNVTNDLMMKSKLTKEDVMKNLQNVN